MEKRFVLFLVLSLSLLMGYMYLMSYLYPPQNPPDRKANVAAREPAEKPDKKDTGEAPKKPAAEKPKLTSPEKPPAEGPTIKPKPAGKEVEKPVAGEPEPSQEWVTLGSADPNSPYRMLVTLTNRGAAVALIELNSPRFRDLDDEAGLKFDRSGYLGHVIVDETVRGAGCPVQAVGPGTPADLAGVMPGDLIKSINGIGGVDDERRITGALGLREALQDARPGQTVELEILRGTAEMKIPVTLTERPLAVVSPEADDPLSFLMTLSRIDDEELVVELEEKDKKTHVDLDTEIEGAALRGTNWTITDRSESKVVFKRVLPRWGLEVFKTYELAKVPDGGGDNAKAYHLTFNVGFRNRDSKPHTVAYQLDGPTGLPIEGWWYSNKISRTWSGVGVRDVVVSFRGATPILIGCRAIADSDVDSLPWQDEPLTFIGVDAQYFSAVMIPHRGETNPDEILLAESRPILVGEVEEDYQRLANTSFRLTSQPLELAPDGGDASRQYTVFVGPKRPKLLARYGLGEIVYYGWFGWVAEPLLMVLHGCHAVVGNYGLAIIMLTVLVRLCMFPLSRKQTLNAIKMQELQPEIKKLQEKHKKDMEARTKAQQELFRKHNYNPLGGCLVMFIQLPIFVALYRSLMVDVELRQAPLLSDSIRWCSNLAAPDMFFDWSGFMPDFVTCGVGMAGLGPYFNILPIVTVLMFLWQQKKLMPPPADEQAAMQQNIMKYMMLFMGVLFFKVASGLCIYFIASSLWGLAERQFLPKRPTASDDDETKSPARPKPKPKSPSRRGGSNGDGAMVRKKKKKNTRGRR